MNAIRPALVAPALLALLLGLPVREARAQALAADSIQAQSARAEALFKEDRYLEAVQVLEQAYTQRQSPGLLYLLGRAHERLGQAREARTYYQRYLAAELSPDPRIQAEVRQSLQRLQAMDPSAPPARPTATQLLGQSMDPDPRDRPGRSDRFAMIPVRVEERPRHRGMLAAGISLLATGYAPALITGAIFASLRPYSYSGSSSTDTIQTAGGLLLIPVVGPILSGIYYPATYRGNETSLYWSLPWVLVDASVQVAGLILIVTGAKTKQRVMKVNYDLSVLPYTTSTGSGMVLSGRF